MSGCTAASPWKLDWISTGEPIFDSARLTYSDGDSPLRFEIVRLDGAVETFISLTKYKFTTSDEVKIEMSIDGEKSEEMAPFLEGKMRLRLPPQITKELLKALQEGKEVAIMVDGFEERLHPERFKSQYEKFAGGVAIFQNPFKGLFDP